MVFVVPVGTGGQQIGLLMIENQTIKTLDAAAVMIDSGDSLDIMSHNGSTLGLTLAGQLVTSLAPELNYNDLTTGPGAAEPLKSLVLDAGSDIAGIDRLGCQTVETREIVSAFNGADAILMHTTGGTSEQIHLRAANGTAADSICIESDLGGVKLNGASVTLDAGAPLLWPTADGSSGWVMTTDGLGALQFTDPGTLSIIPSGTIRNSWTVRDEKAWNVDGGTFTADAWQTRDINTIAASGQAGTLNDCTVLNNQLTLQVGDYIVMCTAPSYGVKESILRLQNITDTSTQEIGTTSYTSLLSDSRAVLRTRFTVTGGPKVFEIQHYGRTLRATNGFGRSHNLVSSNSNIYTEMLIMSLT